MSTLNVSTIIPTIGTNTDLDLSGKGTGRPDLQAGFKVGGSAGVPTASIQDDAVTLAKMASGVDGVIITYDASGNPVHVGPGSDGQVLTSTGAGSPPAFEAAASGPAQATQSALEAETNEDTYAAPDLIKYSPGVAKAWIEFEQDGTHSILASYNITSVTDGGSSGDSDIVIATDFSSANYAITGTAGRGVAGDTPRTIGPGVANPAAGTLTITCSADDGSRVDCEFVSLALFGDQT